MHCRYCFRRHFPYGAQRDLDSAVDAIAADSSIKEIILSGGDPLLLDDPALEQQHHVVDDTTTESCVLGTCASDVRSAYNAREGVREDNASFTRSY